MNWLGASTGASNREIPKESSLSTTEATRGRAEPINGFGSALLKQKSSSCIFFIERTPKGKVDGVWLMSPS